jgi:ArsR family transcriptional regulator
MKMSLCDLALILKSLSDETRLKIVVMLSKGQLCACKILEEFNITQPTLSYHMKTLVDCELVIAEKNGKWVYYSLNEEMLKGIETFVKGLIDAEKTGGCDLNECGE